MATTVLYIQLRNRQAGSDRRGTPRSGGALLAEDVSVAVLVPGFHRRRLRLHPLVLVLLGDGVVITGSDLRRAHVKLGVFLVEPRGSVLVAVHVLVLVVGGEGKRGALVACGGWMDG